MPIYDYECYDCGREFEHSAMIIDRKKKVECGVCGGKSERVIKSSRVTKFKPFWHIALDPERRVYITSKGHLREECKKREVESVYLM